MDGFEPSRRHVQLAHLLEAERPGLARKVLYQLIGQPQTKEEIAIALGEDAEGLSVARALNLLEEDGLVEEHLPQDEARLPGWRISLDGVKVLLTLQTVGSLHELGRQIQTVLEEAPDPTGDGHADGGQARPAIGRLAGAVSSKGKKPDIWHVTTTQDGRWKVKREGASRATSTYDTKKEAVKEAKVIARKRDGGRVVLHRQDGSIQNTIEPK